MNNGVV